MSQYFIQGVYNPTEIATSAPKGALYLRVGDLGGAMFQKMDDGPSKNWEERGKISIESDGKKFDLTKLLSAKEDAGKAGALSVELEARLVKKMESDLGAVKDFLSARITKEISDLETRITQAIMPTVDNRIQALQTEFLKQVEAQIKTTREAVTKEVLSIVVTRANDAVTSATHTASSTARALVDAAKTEVFASLNSSLQNFKSELLVLAGEKADSNATERFSEVLLEARKEAALEIKVFIEKFDKQFVELSDLLNKKVSEVKVSYEIVDEKMLAFADTVWPKVDARVTTIFDASKAAFKEAVINDVKLRVNQATSELIKFVNDKVK